MNKTPYYTIKWKNNRVSLIDQRYLPSKEIYRNYKKYSDVVKAIKTMEIRGAPAIGVAAAMGIALGVSSIKNRGKNLTDKFNKIVDDFLKSRPTAVNLFWAADRMNRIFEINSHKPLNSIKKILIEEAKKIYSEDVNANKKLSAYGEKLIKKGCRVLTHCNAGALATARYGTALGVILAAHAKHKIKRVYADETRPRLQGARLTAWELLKNRVPVTLISDNMAGYLMKKGEIDIVITGADRIALNGDTANKIGTYGVAVLAHNHKIPFYIAAPVSTFDPECIKGDNIPIEQRSGIEITNIGTERIAPKGINTFNPAFDVTPHKLIKGIITEKGIIKPPYKKSIKSLFK